MKSFDHGFHGIDSGEECSPFPIDRAVESEDMPALTLAYHAQHPEYAMLVTEMTHMLAAQGIKLAIIELDYITWAKGEANVDLWLGTVNFAVPEEWNVGAGLLGSPLLRQCMTGGDSAK